MKKMIKKIGRFFIHLEHKQEEDLRQSVILVDGSYILPNNFALIINGVKKKFGNCRLIVLAFDDKETFIKENFPDVEVYTPNNRCIIRRWRMAFQLLLLLRKKINFIVLSSLDISLVSTAMMFARCPVFLHNRWLQWYTLRKRTISNILSGKSIDTNRRRVNKGVWDIIKKLGRFFVILDEVKEKDIRYRLLIEDNGYTGVGHILTAVEKAQRIFINPDITLLTFENRRPYFSDKFSDIKLVSVQEGANKYGLALKMFRLRKNRYNCVILTTLDISPIIISFLALRTKVLLYNWWNQWWVLSFRNTRGYLNKILIFLVMVPVFAFLFFFASFILLRISIRLIINSLFKKEQND